MTDALVDSIWVAVGLCLLVAAWKKARDISGFRKGIDTFRIIPVSWSGWMAWMVVATEALLALGFLGGFYLQELCWIGLILMAVFGGVTASARVRGVAVNCNCFGVRCGSDLDARLGALDIADGRGRVRVRLDDRSHFAV